jgi:DNA polymerase-3 subunit delta'
METLLPPEQIEDFLAAPRTRLAIEQVLQQDAARGGFILTGPDGAGKASLAYLLAMTVLSGGERLGETDPKVRAMIAAGSHPDLRVLRRTENEKTGKLRQDISVDQVREVIARMHQRSVSGRSIVIVDLADELGRSAANSLLKLLEEPPQGAALFLLSRAPSLLLPTLRSRCRKITLRPVAEDALASWLSKKTGEPAAVAAEAARQSSGAPGYALRLLVGEEQEAAKLADSFDRAVAGKADLLAAARKFAARDTERLAEEAQRLIVARLRRSLTDPKAGDGEKRRYLAAHDEVSSLFANAGTADRTQTVYLAGLAIRNAMERA